MVLNEMGPKDHMGTHCRILFSGVAFITMRSFKDLYSGANILKTSGSGIFWGSVNWKHNVMVSIVNWAESRVACEMGLCVLSVEDCWDCCSLMGQVLPTMAGAIP